MPRRVRCWQSAVAAGAGLVAAGAALLANAAVPSANMAGLLANAPRSSAMQGRWRGGGRWRAWWGPLGATRRLGCSMRWHIAWRPCLPFGSFRASDARLPTICAPLSRSCGKTGRFWPRNRVLARVEELLTPSVSRRFFRPGILLLAERLSLRRKPGFVPERGSVAKNREFCRMRASECVNEAEKKTYATRHFPTSLSVGREGAFESPLYQCAFGAKNCA